MNSESKIWKNKNSMKMLSLLPAVGNNAWCLGAVGVVALRVSWAGHELSARQESFECAAEGSASTACHPRGT